MEETNILMMMLHDKLINGDDILYLHDEYTCAEDDKMR